MRRTLVPGFLLLASLAGVPAPLVAQPALPARAFEPSLPAVSPLPVAPVVEWWRNGGPRIRPTDQRSRMALRLGEERSVIFRDLLKAVDTANIFVYVGMDPRMPHGLMGRLTFGGNTGVYRYLRVMLNPELGVDAMVAALAHELRHVVEVIEHPEVVSEATLSALYGRIGRANRVGGVPGFETDAALDAGFLVRKELILGTEAALARNRQGDARDGRR